LIVDQLTSGLNIYKMGRKTELKSWNVSFQLLHVIFRLYWFNY